MKKLVGMVIILACMVSFSQTGFSQCKGFTKKECLPKIKPYVYNGQLNSAILNEGDVAELLLTFYAGQDYRVYVCNQQILGKIEFKLLDTDHNLIFSNKENDMVEFWDFKSNSTQQLIIQVKVPQGESNSNIVQSGCVSILVGFKE